MRTRILLLGATILLLSGCSPETGSVTGLTRNGAGDLQGVILTCTGAVDSIRVETNGGPHANTEYVWEEKRTDGTLRVDLTRTGLKETDLLEESSSTAEVTGYDARHRWNSIPLLLTPDILTELKRGHVTYGNPERGMEFRQVTEKEYQESGCAMLEMALYVEGTTD